MTVTKLIPPTVDVDPQTWYENLPICDTLLEAPAGCGKTEHLARRAAALVHSRAIETPRQVLALTFSNRARSNLRSRIHQRVGSPFASRSVCVQNFHGFSHRLLRHHGALVGFDPASVPPQNGWHRELVRTVATEWRVDRDELERTVRSAKSGPFDDDEVMERLEASGLEAAVAYEEALREQRRPDFDDLLRHAVRLLQIPQVVRLYRERFAVVLVDEVQDLSRLQYGLVADLGLGRTVFAGDLVQGIYRFAGADPDWVVTQIEARDPVRVSLELSHRSSPAVLRVVSALTSELGGGRVNSVDPAGWRGKGRVVVVKASDVETEAAEVARRCKAWLKDCPDASVAIVVRAKNRRQYIDAQVARSGIAAEIWDLPVHSPFVVQLIREKLGSTLASQTDERARLDELYYRCIEQVDPDDIDTLDELKAAFDELGELITERPLAEIVDGIRTLGDPSVPAPPGLHLLNGHVGKGQQFTRVVVAGMEEHFMPHCLAIKTGREEDIRDELAVLHVMASRAQEDLIFTSTRVVPNRDGNPRRRDPSRWLPIVEAVADEVVDI